MTMNDILNSTIQGNNSEIIEFLDITYNLTVTDMKEFVVQ